MNNVISNVITNEVKPVELKPVELVCEYKCSHKCNVVVEKQSILGKSGFYFGIEALCKNSVKEYFNMDFTLTPIEAPETESPKEYATLDECEVPLSNCCDHPPVKHTNRCGICFKPCMWWDDGPIKTLEPESSGFETVLEMFEDITGQEFTESDAAMIERDGNDRTIFGYIDERLDQQERDREKQEQAVYTAWNRTKLVPPIVGFDPHLPQGE